MAGRFPEVVGRFILFGPLALVGVGGDLFGTAAELLLCFGLLLLDPLVHLHVLEKFDAHPLDAKVGRNQLVAGCCHAADMNQLLLVGGIHLVGARSNNSVLAFVQALCRLNRTAFVPPQKGDGSEEQENANADTLD